MHTTQNVEALSTDEEGIDANPCDIFAVYSRTGVSSGDVTLRIHIPNTTNLDYVEQISFRQCKAWGDGNKKGHPDVIFDQKTISKSIDTCLGPSYHVNTIQDVL